MCNKTKVLMLCIFSNHFSLHDLSCKSNQISFDASISLDVFKYWSIAALTSLPKFLDRVTTQAYSVKEFS